MLVLAAELFVPQTPEFLLNQPPLNPLRIIWLTQLQSKFSIMDHNWSISTLNFFKNIVEIEILLLLLIFKDIFQEIIQGFHGIDIFWDWIFNKDSL